MWSKIVLLVACVSLCSAFPMKLLRVPKIYNALITTNQKLVPSEAFPASTGPVFQPVGLSGDPVLLNPEAFAKTSSGETAPQPGETPRGFSKEMPAPVVFYPRYNIYHQLPQSVFPYTDIYQPPPVVVPAQRSAPPSQPREKPADAGKDAEGSSGGASEGFVTNNSPEGIPSVAPPPPPVASSSSSPVGPIPGL